MSVGFSLAYPVTCSSHLFLFLPDLSHYFIPISLCPWLPLSLFLFQYASLSSLFLWCFPSLLSVCLQCVCDRAAWQEGRQADGHWDLEWLRSGAGSAHGEHVFPTSVKCQRTPIHCLNPQFRLWMYMCRPCQNCFAIIKTKHIHASRCWTWSSFCSSAHWQSYMSFYLWFYLLTHTLLIP